MKIAYTDKLRLGNANMQRLETINGIIDEYVAQSYVMTLRQLYYQLVARDVIANNVQEYRRLSVLLTKGRMAGVVDWNAIEDRGRQKKIPYWCHSVSDALNDTLSQYRIDRQKNQLRKVEVWVEKDALSNIFYRVTSKYHVPLMVNKGYSSCSAMHDAYMRMKNDGRPCSVIYFGDHDPSGLDMVRDIRERLQEFGLSDFEVVNPALNMQQIKKYELPENPAKVTDPRAKVYIEKYGGHSWELDALEPPVLAKIIENAILDCINEEDYDEAIEEEKSDKRRLRAVISKFDTDDSDEQEDNQDDE